jgi:hypothetical protein
MFTLKYAKDPVWNSDDGQQIHLTVRFEEINEDLPFNATSFDCEAHGRDLFERAKAGEFGEIQPYVPPNTTQPNTTGTQSA